MMTGDGLLELRRRTTLVRGISPRGARHWGAALRDQTHMRVVGVKRAWSQPSSFFFKLRSTAHRCRPVELWATHCVVQAQRQIHRVAGPVHRRWPENAFSDQDCRSTMTVSFRALRSVARAHLYRLRL